MEHHEQERADGIHEGILVRVVAPGACAAQRPAASAARLGAVTGWAYAETVTGIEPIVVSVELAASPERAFEAFTAGFTDWWPAATYSLSRKPGTRCRLDARAGGAVEERAADGTCQRWGTVETAEPGQRLRFSWHPDREADSAQWVDVVFLARGDGSRVTLTHGGWEALGEIAPILRREYASGWQHVFGKIFADYADRHE
jgi:uncharacterized protein YndB with AHSA1/START domain